MTTMLVTISLPASEVTSNMTLHSVRIREDEPIEKFDFKTYILSIDYNEENIEGVCKILQQSTINILEFKYKFHGDLMREYEPISESYLNSIVAALIGNSDVEDIFFYKFDKNWATITSPIIIHVIEQLEQYTSVQRIHSLIRNPHVIQLKKPMSEREIPIQSRTKSALKR